MFAPDLGLTVLGIDPGLTRCGYCVLHSVHTKSPQVVALGVMTTPPDAQLQHRLFALQQDIEALIEETQPQAIAIEQVFFESNVRTAMSVGQVSGLVLAMASRLGIDVVQYSPSQVKNSVTGSGRATKLQVQKMVQQRLGLTSLPQPADAADAAAIALCHLAVAPLRGSIDKAITKVGAR
ncbi:MAG: crossover junction endodeoxyribonuclease RuvC [Actinobacteria bacterium]|nr:MAG: crossover junction endodeoxyribonuclease RuvC [Actinomycetota bacterium]